MCDINEKEPVRKNVIIVKVIIVCFAVNFLSLSGNFSFSFAFGYGKINVC